MGKSNKVEIDVESAPNDAFAPEFSGEDAGGNKIPSSPLASEASFSSSSPHYDDKKDVVAQIEVLSDKATKRIALSIWGATAFGFGILLAALILVTTKPQSWWFQTDVIFAVNTGLASAQVLLLGFMLFYFTRRVVRATITGKRWSLRRLRGVQSSATELCLQFINSVLYLTCNAYALVRSCSWFSSVVIWTSFASWTIWNTFFLLFLVQVSNLLPLPAKNQPKSVDETSTASDERDGIVQNWKSSGKKEPQIYMDENIIIHWNKLILWVAMEAFLLTLSIDLAKTPATTPSAPALPLPLPSPSCKTAQYTCEFTTTGQIFSNLVAATSVVYLLLYIWYVWSAFRVFYRLPYVPFRMGNLLLRMQVRQRGVAFLFFIANIIVYFYVKRGTCASYIISWHGFAPMQLVMTVVAATQAFLASPKKPEQTAILQVWLQEFAWTERDIPRKREERVSSLPEDSFIGFCMDCEPLFCFETGVKLMYWSFLAYDTGELPDSPFSSATALGLFGLRNFEVVWEGALNTKAVIGWDDESATVVIAFRGTASAANVMADLQVWRARYPKGVGNPFLGTAPMVHQGFHRAYTRNKFNDTLLSKVQHILNRCQLSGGATPNRPVKVYITGHSLGGALAVLCAYDVATRTPCAAYDVDVACYTFGAPRVGNHAWARLYNTTVPDTWQIINSDDVITRAGKFFVLMKHVGHRVLLNRRGDLVVRPSFVEYSMRRSPGGSVKDHFLTSYERAVVAVVAAQFGSKSLGGKEEAKALAEEEATKLILKKAGLSLEDVERLEEGTGEVARLKSLDTRIKSSLSERKRRKKESMDLGGRKMTLAGKCIAWWERLEGVMLAGRKSLQAVATAEPVRTASGIEAARPEEEERMPVPGGDEQAEMESREKAESGLLQCQAMCGRMGNKIRPPGGGADEPGSSGAPVPPAVRRSTAGAAPIFKSRNHPKSLAMASVHAIGPLSYTTASDQYQENKTAIFDATNIALTSKAATDAIKSLSQLESPLIVGSTDAIASGLVLIFLAVKSKLSAEEAIRLGSTLQLPATQDREVAAWVSTSVQDITTGSIDSFIFKQLFDPTSSTYTYLLADADTKEAVLIDPVLEQVDRDIKVLEELVLNLIYAINTHCHADHVTGTGQLKRRPPSVKSAIAAQSGAQADIQFDHGSEIVFGKHKLTVISTPGHTNGCVSFFTESHGGAVFTGDALLIRGCGRTDFQYGSASTLFDSVHQKIFTLDSSVSVYPAHDYRGKMRSSVIEEKLLNPRLTKSKEEFVKIMAELGLPYPKKIDVALPSNMVCGIHE